MRSFTANTKELLSRNKSTNDEGSLHQICAVCSAACRQSVVLNDVNFIYYFSKHKLVISDDDGRFPLRQSIPDANQWNEDLPYLFEREIPHHASADGLETSALNGCHLCSLLWNHLSLERYGILKTEVDVEEKRLAEESRAAARVKIKESTAPLFVRIFIDDPARKSWDAKYSGIVLYAGSHTEALPELRSVLCLWPTKVVESITKMKLKGDGVGKLNKSTASTHTIAQARKWIKACRNEIKHGQDHFLCANSFKTTSWPTPTRLLDLGFSPFHSKTVRLRKTDLESSGTVEYACLSHCWGGADAMKLTTENLTHLENHGVEVAQLPPTYRDAIDITRRLGLRYLWIDSLCIVQDSPSDWQQEASRMGSVYSHAVVTVAALAAKNSYEGCYFSRDPLSYWPCVLPTTTRSSPLSSESESINLTAWYGRVWPFHNERLTNSPLLQRGWVTQERCLGSRMLYFGRFGVYWECATMRADDIFTSGFEHDWLGDTGQGLLAEQGDIMAKALVNRRLYLVGQDAMSFPLHVRIDELAEGDHVHPWVAWKFLGYWYHIVGWYSRAKLTFSRDKLVAFAGVIDLVQKRTAMTSLAGLWRELLLDDLLWSSADPASATRPPEYRAPSFSWASVDGRVQRKFDRFLCRKASNLFLTEASGIPHLPQAKYLAEVVSDDVKMASGAKDHTGEVSRAEIVLKGYPLRYATRKQLVELDGEEIWSHPWCHDLGKMYKGIFNKWLELDVEADGAEGVLEVTLLPIMAWYKDSPAKAERGVAKEKSESDGNNESENNEAKPESASKESNQQTEGEVYTSPGFENEGGESDTGPSYSTFHVAGLVLQTQGEAKVAYKRIGMFEHCAWTLDREDDACKDRWTFGKTQETLTLL